jgi:hypothetical protein
MEDSDLDSDVSPNVYVGSRGMWRSRKWCEFEQGQMVELLPSAHWRAPVTVSCRITETRLWRETGRKHSEMTVLRQLVLSRRLRVRRIAGI